MSCPLAIMCCSPDWVQHSTYVDSQQQPFAQGLDETQLTYVDSQLALQALARELSTAREIAVDLEAHSYRSFQGFCCLMQLSTRDADYLIDVLALRQSIGPCLGPIFADAKVGIHLLRQLPALALPHAAFK